MNTHNCWRERRVMVGSRTLRPPTAIYVPQRQGKSKQIQTVLNERRYGNPLSSPLHLWGITGVKPLGFGSLIVTFRNCPNRP